MGNPVRTQLHLAPRGGHLGGVGPEQFELAHKGSLSPLRSPAEATPAPVGAVDRRLTSLEHHHPSRGHFSARADSYEVDSCRHTAELLVPTVPSQDLAPR